MRARRGLGAGLVLLALLAAFSGGSASGRAAPLDVRVRPLARFRLRRQGRRQPDYPIKIHDVSLRERAQRARPRVPRRSARARGRFPAVIWAHGSGVTRNDLLLPATWFAARGAIGYVPDDPFERNPQLNLASDARQRAAIVQQVIDLRRSVDLLQSRRDVEPKRIGFIGLSFGAIQGAFLAGAEPPHRGVRPAERPRTDLRPGPRPDLSGSAVARRLPHPGRPARQVVPRAAARSTRTGRAAAEDRPLVRRAARAEHARDPRPARAGSSKELGLDGPVVRGAVAGP